MIRYSGDVEVRMWWREGVLKASVRGITQSGSLERWKTEMSTPYPNTHEQADKLALAMILRAESNLRVRFRTEVKGHRRIIRRGYQSPCPA